MVEVLLLAAGVGLVFNAAPGAVFAESLRRGLRGGFRPALAVHLGSLLGDALWAVLGLAGAGALFTLPVLRIPLTVGGCLLMCLLGAREIRNAISPPPTVELTARPSRRKAAYVGTSMSLGNPLNVVYWAGISGTVNGVLGREPGFTGLAVFFAGFMLSSLVWCFVCAGGIALLHHTLPAFALRVVEGLCGAVLVGLATLPVVQLV
jgi:chemosensory pili system protein ChpE